MSKYINNFAPQTRSAEAHHTEKYQVTFDITMGPDFDNQFLALKMLEIIFMEKNPVGKWNSQMTVTKIDSVTRI
jgi:hypothetical protein